VVLLAEHYGYTLEDLVVLSGGHSIGFSASTNPQVCASQAYVYVRHVRNNAPYPHVSISSVQKHPSKLKQASCVIWYTMIVDVLGLAENSV